MCMSRTINEQRRVEYGTAFGHGVLGNLAQVNRFQDEVIYCTHGYSIGFSPVRFI